MLQANEKAGGNVGVWIQSYYRTDSFITDRTRVENEKSCKWAPVGIWLYISVTGMAKMW